MRPTHRILFVSLAAVALIDCAKNEVTPGAATGQEVNSISPKEAQAIAEEAYVYAYPMLETYRTMYVQAVDKNSGSYEAPFNQFAHTSQLLGPEFKDVVRPNNDTLYSFAWLDLRAQPTLITVPEIEGRYYSVQLIDLFTQNIGYIGTRATKGVAGSYLVAGPQWQGAKPGGVTGVIRSDSDFLYCIVRIEVRGKKDVATVTELQRQFRLTPMYQFLGRSRIPVAAGITFPRYDERKATSSAFIDYFNLLLTQVRIPSTEDALMKRFARIGVSPGMLSASQRFDAATRDAVNAGVGAALVKISKAGQNLAELDGVIGRQDGGWLGAVGIFGSPKAMQGRYLVRAAAAMVGLYGNDAREAYYPMANTDAARDPLNGSAHRYVLRFEKDQLPPVDAFWSLTMYSLPDQLMVANPIDRYSIGDRSKLSRGKDGSVTIYIQHTAPAADRTANWLPAPDGPFSLQMRMYLPKAEALEPLYLPPPITLEP